MRLLLAVDPILDPGWDGLGLAAVLMVVVVAAATTMGVKMIREGLVATARTTLQLLGVGFVLGWVFELRAWYAVLGVLFVMTLVAGWTGNRRVERALKGTGPAMTLILAGVLALTLLYVLEVVIGLEELDPRYVIPLGGMILGNAMTAGSLAAQRFHDDMREGRGAVEAALALGATPAQASQRAVRRAFRAAITPMINAMLIVGIVKLPGVMTGQMLGGSAPLDAAKYQIVVMFMLAFSDGLTALLTLAAVRRLAFTAAWQPRL